MSLRKVCAVCAMFLLPLVVSANQNSPDDFVVHGTINVALGNENGLVLLTDSMVTAGGRQRAEPGQKLFRLDDHTVCSIAGFVSAPAASTRAAVSDLNTSTSAIIHEYVRKSERQPPQSIAEKLRALAFLIDLHLSTIANVRDALGNVTPPDIYRFQLIVVGYDIDDKPKIGRITLRMRNDNGSFISEIEDASIVDVGEKLVWRLNGIPDVATRILLHPESEPKDAAIHLYATSVRESGGRSLTVEQMVELAKKIAYYTSKAYPEVGGSNQVAIFRKSHSVSIEQPPFPEPPRPLVNFDLVVNSSFSYSGIAFAKGGSEVFVRCSWTGMQRELDGNYFIGNIFTNSVLTYDGGGVNLGDTNQVINSTLIIGMHAKLDDEAVRALIKAFAWSRVLREVPKTELPKAIPSP